MECDRDAVETPTLGVHEVVVQAWLGCLSLAAAQAHRLALTDVAVLDESPPEEGTRP